MNVRKRYRDKSHERGADVWRQVMRGMRADAKRRHGRTSERRIAASSADRVSLQLPKRLKYGNMSVRRVMRCDFQGADALDRVEAGSLRNQAADDTSRLLE